ncbi:hypothetical protein LIER_12400 [Lithospermum erythrorhizon]|uniref:Uncharacterized protein n=1 Tax=Lithospermum erythrorhizon TaxID=34254 RepID=A0AAV3PT34_LITER
MHAELKTITWKIQRLLKLGDDTAITRDGDSPPFHSLAITMGCAGEGTNGKNCELVDKDSNGPKMLQYFYYQVAKPAEDCNRKGKVALISNPNKRHHLYSKTKGLTIGNKKPSLSTDGLEASSEPHTAMAAGHPRRSL